MTIRLDYKSDLRERRAAARERARQSANALARRPDKAGLLAQLKASAARRKAQQGEPHVRH